MNIAVVLFVLAALGGLAMLVIRLKGASRPPTWMALGHGVIALLGLATLGVFYTQTVLPPSAGWALVVFILAALGGITVFVGFHLRNRPLPIPIVIGHGLIAATGIALLLKAIYS